MNTRTDIEIFGLALLINVDPSMYFHITEENLNASTQNTIQLWKDMFAKANEPPPKDLNNLKFTGFRKGDFICISIKLPEPTGIDQSYHGCGIIGPIPNMESLTTDEIKLKMNSTHWDLFTLKSGIESYKICHYMQNDDISNPHFVEISTCEYMNELDFTTYMTDQIINAHQKMSIRMEHETKKEKGCFTKIIRFGFYGGFILFISMIVIGKISKSNSDSRPKKEIVYNSQFDMANRKIDSDKNGSYTGNTNEAKEMAKNFSLKMFELEKELFSGGKENRLISLTGDKFLTYCRVTKNKVCFLVHVPQFKRYKGKTRDTLLELSWLLANKLSSDFPKNTEIAVCLRGSLMYGGVVHGVHNKKPVYINDYSIDKEKIYPLFD